MNDQIETGVESDLYYEHDLHTEYEPQCSTCYTNEKTIHPETNTISP